MAKARSHLTFANVVAMIALFVALSGTGFAAPVADTAASLGSSVKKALKIGKRADKTAKRALSAANAANSAAKGSQQGLANVYTKPESDARFLGKGEKASDSSKLDGLGAGAFLGATASAVDSDKLDGQDSSAFLAATAKAADAETLDGIDSGDFMHGKGFTASRRMVLDPGSGDFFTMPGTTDTAVGYSCPAVIASPGTLNFHTFNASVDLITDDRAALGVEFDTLSSSDKLVSASALGSRVIFHYRAAAAGLRPPFMGVVTMTAVHTGGKCRVYGTAVINVVD
jgi:hypothetical protein